MKYHREEEKDPVVIDKDEINKLNVNVIKDDFIKLRDKGLKHNSIKLSLRIFEELIKYKKENNKKEYLLLKIIEETLK